MHPLYTLLAERVASGLRRSAINKCSKWSCEYRMMGQPFPGQWSWEHHPWLQEMHDCASELMIGQKAAQMGYTETALNKCFYTIDMKGTSVLYVLPASKPDASDFSTSRFDPALESSPHLKTLFTDVQNINHKRAGYANLFIRGSKSRSQMKSVPAGLVILDEVDEMNQKNISLVFERTSGQLQKQIFMLSTPTIDKYGINYYFLQSTQEHYHFRCPHCSKMTELIYPDCLKITADNILDQNIVNSYLLCKECKHKLEHAEKVYFLKNGEWVKSHQDRLSRGFYINQLYSMTVTPLNLAQAVFNAQKDPADEQELYNSKFGVTHAVKGARVSDNDIELCLGDYLQLKANPVGAFITIGVDVGTWLHYVIKQWFLTSITDSTDLHANAKCRIIRFGKVEHFEELDKLVYKYHPQGVVIDANPERRKSYEFAARFDGIVRACFYGRGISGRQVVMHPDESHTMSVDRTSWLDLTLGRYKQHTITLPRDTDAEYRDHIKALVRIYEKDKDGNPTGRYVKGTEDDHYAHADNYAEIALDVALSAMKNEDIR